MDEKRLQTSESLFLTALLAIVGGFLDAYSYLLRGGVFANAQTGNIALLGVYIQRRNGSMIRPMDLLLITLCRHLHCWWAHQCQAM